MRLSAHSSWALSSWLHPSRSQPGAVVLAAVLLAPLAGLSQKASPAPQPKLAREGDRWVRMFYGSAPAGYRLRVNAHGPVTFHGGAANNLQYTVRVSVRARTEAQAQHVLEHYSVRLASMGEWMVLTAPGGPVISTVSVKAPRLKSVEISTSDGPVEASAVDGPLMVDTGAGELSVDR